MTAMAAIRISQATDERHSFRLVVSRETTSADIATTRLTMAGPEDVYETKTTKPVMVLRKLIPTLSHSSKLDMNLLAGIRLSTVLSFCICGTPVLIVSFNPHQV
jgi:hypothetical protein